MARASPPCTDVKFVVPGHSRPKDGVASLAYDPGIHEAARRNATLPPVFADTHHGLPDQARQRRTRGPVRLSVDKPGHDEGRFSASGNCSRIAFALLMLLLLMHPAQAQLRGHGGPVRALAI